MDESYIIRNQFHFSYCGNVVIYFSPSGDSVQMIQLLQCSEETAAIVRAAPKGEDNEPDVDRHDRDIWGRRLEEYPTAKGPWDIE